MLFERLSSVCISYDANYLRDGAGSQLARQIGAFVVSRQFKVPYHHEDILSVDGNYGDGMNSEQEMRGVVEQLNAISGLRASDCRHLLHDEIIQWPSLSESSFKMFLKFLLHQIRGFMRRKRILIAIGNPHTYLNSRTFLYNDYYSAGSVSDQFRNCEKLNIHLHIMGAKDLTRNQDRYVNINFFRDISRFLQLQFNFLGIETYWTIHTDAPKEAEIWRPPSYTDSKTIQAWKNAGILDSQNVMRVNGYDFNEFLHLKNLRILRGLNPIESWKEMSQADVMIANKSMFSFIGALINSIPIVLFPEFTIRPLPQWILLNQYLLINELSDENSHRIWELLQNRLKLRYR